MWAKERTHIMAIIKFEGIANVNEAAFVPNGYRGLNWDNFLAEDVSIASGGILAVIHSGRASGFNGFGEPAGFKSPDNADDFDLDGGFFAASQSNGLKVRVFGYDDGEKVAKKTLVLDPEQEFVVFGNEFNDIDEVKFRAKGGTDPDPNDGQGPTTVFAVDDFLIDF